MLLLSRRSVISTSPPYLLEPRVGLLAWSCHINQEDLLIEIQLTPPFPVGTLEFRCAVEGVRKYAKQITFHEAWADNIDFDRKEILCVRHPHRYLPTFFCIAS